MEREDLQVEQFRQQIRELKEEFWKQLLAYNANEQDPTLINTYTDQLEEMYTVLRPFLEGKKQLTEISNPNFVRIFQPIFPSDTPHFILSTCLYYARRDLIMFPLTRDTTRINSLADRNSLENVEFLSNK